MPVSLSPSLRDAVSMSSTSCRSICALLRLRQYRKMKHAVIETAVMTVLVMNAVYKKRDREDVRRQCFEKASVLRTLRCSDTFARAQRAYCSTLEYSRARAAN